MGTSSSEAFIGLRGILKNTRKSLGTESQDNQSLVPPAQHFPAQSHKPEQAGCAPSCGRNRNGELRYASTDAPGHWFPHTAAPPLARTVTERGGCGQPRLPGIG
ncbi:unnamed protein product, partial [Bubo scandiacus]